MSDSDNKSSLWTSRIGVGAILGVSMVVIAVVLIVINETTEGVFRDVEPPDFIGQDTPRMDHNEVCRELKDAGGREKVRDGDVLWNELGWPNSPPKAVLVDCPDPHEPAPKGTVRYHSCDSTRLVKTKDFVDPLNTPPCMPASGSNKVPAGRMWPRIENGHLVGADVYISVPVMKDCTWAHEGGHWRGLYPPKDFDKAENPYVTGGHTERPDHLMGESCGNGTSWLDRNEGGDWPYGEGSKEE